MGNKHQGSVLVQNSSVSSKMGTELALAELIENDIFQEYQQKQRYSLCCINKKLVKKKITWEEVFISNCQELKAELGYEWLDGLIEIVKNNQLPRARYYKEIQNLGKEKPETLIIGERPILSHKEQVQKFKKNLKKSVIISFSQNPESADLPKSSIRDSFPIKTSKIQNKQVKKNCYKSGFFRQKQKAQPLNKLKPQRSYSSKSQVLDLNKDVPKKAATQLQVFLKFSSILQRHLSESSCILGQLRKKFVYYFQQNLKDVSKSSQWLTIAIETVQVFITLLNTVVQDYYNLKLFKGDALGSNMFISSQQNIISTCTAILFRDHQFYNCLFSYISFSFKEREEKFNKILKFLSGSGPERFQVKDKFCLNIKTIKSYLSNLAAQSQDSDVVQNIEINDVVVSHSQPYKACMLHLKEMAKSRSPINKLKSLMACSQGITVQIQKFYDLNSLHKQKWMLDADQILSIFCYLIVGARVEHIHTHLFLLDNFASSHQMIEMTGYYLSVMNCAVEHLEHQFGKEAEGGSLLK